MAVTDLLRVRVDATKAGKERPLIDTTFHCTGSTFVRWSDVLDRSDLDMAGVWQRAGWDLQLRVYDPDRGDDSDPIAHLHIVAPRVAARSTN